MMNNFISTESDDDVTEGSPPGVSVEESAEALLHGAISALEVRARQIVSHQSGALIAIAEAGLQRLSITSLQCCDWLLVVFQRTHGP